MKPLSPEEIRRYSRHLTLPQVGVEGQQRLARASVLLVGVGGLGSPAATYLAAAGIGRIGLVEFDRVDESNLQRQILYGDADVGRAKGEVAQERLRALNPHIQIDRIEGRFDHTNGVELVRDYDLVLDGSDNFETRYWVNDACVLAHRPNVYGSIFRFEGQVSIFCTADGPCYRCLFPEPPPPDSVPNCAEGGVLGVLPGTVGTLQATEALKWILGIGESAVGRLLIYDALELSLRELRVRRDPTCRSCGVGSTLQALEPSRRQAREVEAPEETIGPAELKALLDGSERPPRLLDVRTAREREIAAIAPSAWIPLDEIERRLDELSVETPWIIYCKSGARGARAVAILRRHGFGSVRNLIGGIDRWATEIDGELPRY